MADPTVVAKRVVTNITLASSSAAAKPGSLIGRSGSDWVLADADAATPIPAVWIATQYIDPGVTGEVAREVVLKDTDAPYTVGQTLYLSGTAGGHTSTRPTTAGALRQVVGQALTTELADFRIENPKEVEVPLVIAETTSGEAALGSRVALDSGFFEGPTTNAQNEYITYHALLPDNYAGLVRAELWSAQDSAGSPTFNIDVASAVAGANHDAVTADTSVDNAVIGANAAGDPLDVYEFSAALDATGILKPGALLAIKVLQSDAGTVAVIHLGGRLIVKTV